MNETPQLDSCVSAHSSLLVLFTNTTAIAAVLHISDPEEFNPFSFSPTSSCQSALTSVNFFVAGGLY